MAPGQQPRHGVDDDQRRELAAGQHVVADRQLEVDEVADPLVDALVARADEDQVRARRRGRRPAPGGRPRRPASSRIAVESGRRSASRASATGSGRRTMPAPPPYGASSTLRCRPRPHWRRSWIADRRRGPRSRDPARDALRQRALEHAREQADDVDLEGHRRRRSLGGRRRTARRPRRRGFAPLPWRDQRGRRRGLAASRRRAVDRRAAEVEDRLVDDDLAALRRERRDDVADRRHVELAGGPPRTT